MFRQIILFRKSRRFSNDLAVIFLLVLIFSSVESSAAPRRHSFEEENHTMLREMRDSIDDLRHEINNHEAEIRIFQEKLNNQETIIESLQQDLSNANQLNRNLLKEASGDIESKTTSLESSLKGVITDLRQMKTHASDSTNTLVQYKQKILDLEKLLELQNQNIGNLQSALRSIMEVLQIKNSPNEDKSTKIYKVKAGDSLEKIARNHQTTIQGLKELNGLSNDRIIVGQNLKIPD